jgi:hypothetical protein
MNSYEKTKKALFEKECLKAKENVSEEQFESLFTNQDIFDLDTIVGEDLIYRDAEYLENHFKTSKMSLNSTITLKNAVSVIKSNTAQNKVLSQRPKGVQHALIISFRTRRSDDYHRAFKVKRIIVF